ncbi:MAG: histidinol-phosphate aminotransferase family protein [Oscillospiraceae bacterium]|jgi:histidinol-phosphate aminotransferase|nr:histidinol-phosphate aminotransferase family protein [Oscillospiraceae bacterium]
MPYRLPEKLQNLVPYDPIAGEYPVRLDANESFLPMQSFEKEALRSLERCNLRRYPDASATALRKAAGVYFGVPAEYITAFNGTDELLSILATAFTEPANRKVMCYRQDFSMYAFYSSLAGAEVIQLEKNADGTIDTESTIAALQAEQPAIFIFSNPCNPTSLVLPQEQVRRLLAAAPETLVCLDEAYMEFAEESLLGEFRDYGNLLLLKTLSKAVGLAGLRLGFAVANTVITKALNASRSPYNVGVIPQALGTAILSHPAHLREAAERIKTSRDTLAAKLGILLRIYPEVTVVGKAANFLYVRFGAPYSAEQCFLHLKARGVIVRCFAGDGALRITCGTPAENTQFLFNLELYFLEEANNANVKHGEGYEK